MISFEFTDIQEQIRNLARNFAIDEILPSVINRDINAEYPAEILTKLGELGFMGMMAKEEWGGAGLDSISYVLAIEEISKVDASVAVVMSVQNSLVDWIMEKYASDYLKEKYLTKLVQGKFIGSYCLSEPDAGSDAREIRTFAKKDGSKWIINGSKSWITSASNADIHIVFAQTDWNSKHRGFAAFVVEKNSPGLEILKKEDKMGLRSSDTCFMGFTNVEVPEENLIDKVGQGFYIAMNGLNGGRIGIAAQALGIAQGAFDIAAKYSTERKTFGKLLSDHQLIQAKIAEISMKISAARLLVLKAAYLKDINQPDIKASSEAKLFASTIANDVTREAIQILGGYGYTRDFHVERMHRDAKVTEIYEGASEIQKILIARETFKQYI